MPYFPDFQTEAKIERRGGDLVAVLPQVLIEYLGLAEGDELGIAKARNSCADIWKSKSSGGAKPKV